MRPVNPMCIGCGGEAKQGPRGGFRDRCERCEAERVADRAARLSRVALREPKPPRLCERCRRPTLTGRHRLCPDCGRAAHKRRGERKPRPTRNTTQAGYGWNHQQLRERWRPRVERGEVPCGYCHRLIAPGAPWHLGHPDDDKSLAPTPWHRRCNTRFAASITAPRRRTERRGQ